jgi:hypothetical protein
MTLAETNEPDGRPGFDYLHGIAMQHVALDQRSGIPTHVISWLLYDWMAALIRHDVADRQDVHRVMLMLEDDDVIQRSDAPSAAQSVLDSTLDNITLY